MAYLIELPTYADERGTLTVVEKLLPFDIKRFYCIYQASSQRGGHRHKTTTQAMICLGGSCEIYVNDGKKKQIFALNSPNKCLVLMPEDWHTMDKFSFSSTLLILASKFYDKDDYIDEQYDS